MRGARPRGRGRGDCAAPLTCRGQCDGGSPGGCGVGWVCVVAQASGALCHPVPPACEGLPSCACMDSAEVCPNGGCSDDGSGWLLCQDGG